MSVSPLVSIVKNRSLAGYFDEPVVLFDDQLHLIYRNRPFMALFGDTKPHFSHVIGEVMVDG